MGTRDFVAEVEVHEFVDNEAGYLAWVKRHAEGFVLNTSRAKAPSYVVLHRATCPLIASYSKAARPGGFTTREYIKICGPTIDSLRDWVRKHGRPDGSFTSLCATCEPA